MMRNNNNKNKNKKGKHVGFFFLSFVYRRKKKLSCVRYVCVYLVFVSSFQFCFLFCFVNDSLREVNQYNQHQQQQQK